MTKICPRCENTHIKNGVFCSRKCANVRVQTTEINEKRRKTAILSWKEKFNNPIELEKWKTRSRLNNKNSAITKRKKLLETEFALLNPYSKRIKLLHEQNEMCNKCGISKWNEKPIILQYHHKDGNNKNDDRDNVEMLCPNCHSQTDTWCGKDRKKQ